MTRSIDWLGYQAKDGILETHFYADGGSLGHFKFVQDAIDLSDSDPGEENPEYRLLDTFFSDTMNEELLQQIFERASGASPVRMLVVDPTCPFAKHRARSIVNLTSISQGELLERATHRADSTAGPAAERACEGLEIIAKALKLQTPLSIDATNPNDPDLRRLINQIKERGTVDLRFYSVIPSGPLYFFKNIVLCGRFCSGKSAKYVPWWMVVNDPRRSENLYSVLQSEFEDVWESSYEYPLT